MQHFHSIIFFCFLCVITKTQIKVIYELVNTNCVINTQKDIYLFKVQVFNVVNFQKVVKIYNLIHRIWEPISTCRLLSVFFLSLWIWCVQNGISLFLTTSYSKHTFLFIGHLPLLFCEMPAHVLCLFSAEWSATPPLVFSCVPVSYPLCSFCLHQICLSALDPRLSDSHMLISMRGPFCLVQMSSTGSWYSEE